MFMMRESTGHSLAVPHAALQRTGDGRTLAFDSTSWRHLRAYINLLERLPSGSTGDDTGLAEAVDKLRQAALGFGSPALVRVLLRETPHAVAGEAAPNTACTAMLWWSGGLQASAALVVAVLERMPALAGDWPLAQQVQLLADVAEQARRRVAALVAALIRCKAPLLEAHHTLSDAARRGASLLHDTAAAVDALHERVGQGERQIARLGLFGAHRKHAMLARLHSLQNERAVAIAGVNHLQAQLGAIDAVLEEGRWIGPAMDETIGALGPVRAAWVRFGAGMSELAAATQPGQMSDAAWGEQALDRTEAIREWRNLERAARSYACASLLEVAPQRGPTPYLPPDSGQSVVD